MTDQVLCVILGGGQGSRLSPLTHARSKPAVPLAGKYRLIDVPVSNCLNSGIHRMFVLTQYNSASLNRHIKNTYHFSHFSSAFVDILAAEQTPAGSDWYQGTADAVRRSLPHLLAHEFDYILVLSGDQLYQMDFRDMINTHIASGANASIAVTPVTATEASDFGILKTDGQGWVTSFIEKPKQGLENWVSPTGAAMQELGRNYMASMGIYVFNRKFLIDTLGQFPEEKDFGKEILPRAITTGKVNTFQYNGYWTDIGTVAAFFKANLSLAADLPEFNLFDSEHTLFTRSRMLPPFRVSGTSIDKAMIAEGCIVKADRVANSVLGIRTKIGASSVVVDSYLMGNDFFQSEEEVREDHENGRIPIGVGQNCHIQQAIVDMNCRIGNNVSIVGGSHLQDGDFGNYAVRDGIIVIKKNAEIPHDTVI